MIHLKQIFVRLQMLTVLLLALHSSMAGQNGGWERAYPELVVDYPLCNVVSNIQTADGGYCAVVEGWEHFIFKTDADGNVLWKTELPDSLEGVKFYAIIQTADLEYIVSGNYNSLLRMDVSGTVKWYHTYGDSSWRDNKELTVIREFPDGRLLSAGNNGYTIPDTAHLFITDANGILLDSALLQSDLIQAVHILPNGDILTAGIKDTNYVWSRYNADLQLQEDQYFQTNYNHDYAHASFAPDGSVYFAGPINYYWFGVHKVDVAGHEQWFRTINLKPLSDSLNADYIYAYPRAISASNEACFFSVDILVTDNIEGLLFSLDSAGNFRWFKAAKFIVDLEPTRDGGVLGGGSITVYPDSSGAENLLPYLAKYGPNGVLYNNTIEGVAVYDTIGNCQVDSGEIAIKHRVVKASNGLLNYYALTDTNGVYSIDVPLGNYIVSVGTDIGLSPCLNDIQVSLTSPGEHVTVDFTEPFFACPRLFVSISGGGNRPCMTGRYNGQVRNTGNVAALDAYVEVTLDNFLQFQSSTPAAASVNGQVVRINLGDVLPDQRVAFTVYYQVGCDAPLGYTHCTEAHVYPDTPCVAANALWSGASIGVSGICEGDSVRFRVVNNGEAMMSIGSKFIVIEDDMIQRHGIVPPLPPGGFYDIILPADGSTERLEVQQEPYHPGHSRPSLAVQGCNAGTFSTGFVTRLPLDDLDPWIDITCRENTFAYDPNSKEVYPSGIGANNMVAPGTELEYILHFQNTGTDTAFLVVLKDTLSQFLDPTTIRPGASSHPYTWDLDGTGILTFRFDPIALPDSNVNEPGSKGFVQFNIQHRGGIPLSSQIYNQVSIFFDYNPAVLTNTVLTTIDSSYITVQVAEPFQRMMQVQAWPNPFSDHSVLTLKDAPPGDYRIEVLDAQGGHAVQGAFQNGRFVLHRNGLAAGVYFLKITSGGQLVATGKVILQ